MDPTVDLKIVFFKSLYTFVCFHLKLFHSACLPTSLYLCLKSFKHQIKIFILGFCLFLFFFVIITLKWLHSIMFVSATLCKLHTFWHLLLLLIIFLLPVVKVCMEVSWNGPPKSQIEGGCGGFKYEYVCSDWRVILAFH